MGNGKCHFFPKSLAKIKNNGNNCFVQNLGQDYMVYECIN